jgi:hypothetical protein
LPLPDLIQYLGHLLARWVEHSDAVRDLTNGDVPPEVVALAIVLLAHAIARKMRGPLAG